LRCVSELTHREGNFSRSRGPESSGIDGKNGDAQTSTYRFQFIRFSRRPMATAASIGGWLRTVTFLAARKCDSH